jgi:TetR/AcrR family transcriptional regulator, transcriptional repressor of bet genes
MRAPDLGDQRRAQICSSAAEVIAEHGFAGSTMRRIAEGAGVSTGMLNHYFSNRAEMLTETLVYVSRNMSGHCHAEVKKVQPGEERVRALLRAALPNDHMSVVTWRVWIAAYGEAVRSEELQVTIQSRLEPWYEILAFTLEGIEPPATAEIIPFTWQFDALLNGLAIQWLVSKPKPRMDLADIEEAIVAFCLAPGNAVAAAVPRDVVPSVAVRR